MTNNFETNGEVDSTHFVSSGFGRGYDCLSTGDQQEVCALNVLAAVMIEEQQALGGPIASPEGMELPGVYAENPGWTGVLFDLMDKTSSGSSEVLLGCVTCHNTVGIDLANATGVGQKLCPKYRNKPTIQF